MARYHVRNEHGELVVSTYAELRTLYLRQFIGPEDEVRKEGTDRWQKAGAMPDLREVRPLPWFHGFEFAWLAITIAIGTLIMVFLFMR